MILLNISIFWYFRNIYMSCIQSKKQLLAVVENVYYWQKVIVFVSMESVSIMNGNQNYDTMNNHRICSCPHIWMQVVFTCLWSINILLCISVSTYISRWWVYITLWFYLGNSIALLYAIVCDMRLCIIGYSMWSNLYNNLCELYVKYRNSTSTKYIIPSVNICKIS